MADRHLADRHLADIQHLDDAKGQNVILRTKENFEIESLMTFELALCHSVWDFGDLQLQLILLSKSTFQPRSQG
jgi:hypothetical protein